MDVQLSDEQRLLQDSVERLIEREYSFEQRSQILSEPDGFSRSLWENFAELGWLGVSVAERHGGLGGGATENALICEGLGRAMALEPFVSTIGMGARALALSDEAARADQHLPEVVSGKRLISLAYAEEASRYDTHHVETTADMRGNQVTVTGRKQVVFDAPSADWFVVSARADGDQRDRVGIGLYLVERGADGLAISPFTLMSGARAGAIELNNTPAETLVSPERGWQRLEQVLDWAIAAKCAEAVGAMNAAFEQTLEYVKTRKQFGSPIGQFQVVQHRMVDMYMRVKESRSMMHMVANGVASDEPARSRQSASAAKAFIGQRARAVAQDIVQLHGGVGMTEELSIGHYFRYLTLFCTALGSTDYHLQRYAELSTA
ncbi:MAG: acyl-CoA dehydrogenase family protein [Pseudomonadota bacterium]